MSWTREDTEAWLNDWPLPNDFVWNDQKVMPLYQTKKGFGFWLRTAGPYHKPLRGLFALCHEIMAEIPLGQNMPSPEELAALLHDHAARQGDLPLFPCVSMEQPTDNPTETQTKPIPPTNGNPMQNQPFPNP